MSFPPLVIFPSQRAGKMAVTAHPTDDSLCYTWSNRGSKPAANGANIVYFACTGCRALQSKDPSVKIPTMKANLTAHEWISHPSCAHSCEPLQAATVKSQFIRRSTTDVENGRRRKRKTLTADAIAAAALADTMPIIGTTTATSVGTSAPVPSQSDSAMETDAWMPMTAETVQVKEEPASRGRFSSGQGRLLQGWDRASVHFGDLGRKKPRL
ncbi:hypothetical protein AAVH_36170 [Aphelenchoides avenae]|nr:hypothetical protein AAVH_36170 [Aphelenchus avenae]